MTADFKQAANLAGKILASGQVATQLATVTGTPTGGTWTPYVNGVSAGTVAYNASAATLQTALRTVNASINATGSASGYTITSPTGVPTIVTLGVNALTGGTTPSVAMTGIDTTIYTVPALSAVKIASGLLCNTGISTVVVSVSVVPSGGTVDGTHKVVHNYSLAAGATTPLPELVGGMYDAGAFISVNVAGAGAVTYLLTGAVSS